MDDEGDDGTTKKVKTNDDDGDYANDDDDDDDLNDDANDDGIEGGRDNGQRVTKTTTERMTKREGENEAMNTTNTQGNGKQKATTQCETCGRTKTSRWRLIVMASDGALAFSEDDDGKETTKRTLVCKGCFQKKIRKRTLKLRDKTCADCETNMSTDWHKHYEKKKEGNPNAPADWCNKCYEFKRRALRAVSAKCVQCGGVSARPMLRVAGKENDDDDGDQNKVCQKCYHKERYRKRREAQAAKVDTTTCVNCACDVTTAWRKSINGPPGARVCIACWRKDFAATEPPPQRVHELVVDGQAQTCEFCKTTVSLTWRKSGDAHCCSACYQRTLRQLRKVRCSNCGEAPVKTMLGWKMSSQSDGLCPSCVQAGAPKVPLRRL